MCLNFNIFFYFGIDVLFLQKTNALLYAMYRIFFSILMFTMCVNVEAQLQNQLSSAVEKTILQGSYKYQIDNELYSIHFSENSYQEYSQYGLLLSKGDINMLSSNKYEIVPVESSALTRITAKFFLKILSSNQNSLTLLVSDVNGDSKELVLERN